MSVESKIQDIDSESVESKVRSIIAQQLGVGESEIQLESAFIEDLGADSLDIVEMMMTIEDEFFIEVPEDDSEQIRTVQNAIDYINKHRKAS